jgi:hypothetical protein
MCIFTQSVHLVSDTNIFARGVKSNQFLVYSMTYSAPSQLAMVLPLPIPTNASEDAVRFINLENYPRFFLDMQDGFEMDPGGMNWDAMSLSIPDSILQVHDVGSFEASFVPTIRDFDRLDERFWLPRSVWDKLPDYQDFGFAVFKLKESVQQGITRKADPVHPMAFEFPRRNSESLYFPTVHVHDGIVCDYAAFDHTLYCQGSEAQKDAKWQETKVPASEFMEIVKANGVVDPESRCYRMSLRGQLPNADTFVGEGGYVPG